MANQWQEMWVSKLLIDAQFSLKESNDITIILSSGILNVLYAFS